MKSFQEIQSMKLSFRDFCIKILNVEVSDRNVEIFNSLQKLLMAKKPYLISNEHIDTNDSLTFYLYGFYNLFYGVRDVYYYPSRNPSHFITYDNYENSKNSKFKDIELALNNAIGTSLRKSSIKDNLQGFVSYDTYSVKEQRNLFVIDPLKSFSTKADFDFVFEKKDSIFIFEHKYPNVCQNKSQLGSIKLLGNRLFACNVS